MSVKRVTMSHRPRARDEMHYRTAKMEREIARRKRRAMKLAKKIRTGH